MTPDPRWIAERLERLRTENPVAAAEMQKLYPSAIAELATPWEQLTAEQQAGRAALDQELEWV